MNKGSLVVARFYENYGSRTFIKIRMKVEYKHALSFDPANCITQR